MTIQAGQVAPEFRLRDSSGRSRNPLGSSGKARGPLLLVFFKDDCPTCLYTLPFLARVHAGLKNDGVRIFGISQDDRRRSLAFAEATGIGFPVLLDHDGYEVSGLYGLTSVPTLVLVDESGIVSRVTTGFIRAELERIASELAAGVQAPVPVWRWDGEKIIEAKPG